MELKVGGMRHLSANKADTLLHNLSDKADPAREAVKTCYDKLCVLAFRKEERLMKLDAIVVATRLNITKLSQ